MAADRGADILGVGVDVDLEGDNQYDSEKPQYVAFVLVLLGFAATDFLWGRGTVDMKSGVAVALRLAASVPEPATHCQPC